MKKEIRVTDAKRGIVQVTIADERWYMQERRDPTTDLPTFHAVPSVTWIAHHYPKGVGYMKWLADHGWDESQALMREAGDKGSKVHEAISAILAGAEVRIDSKFINKSSGREEELTLEEVDCIKSFVDWKNSLESFEPIAWDLTVFSDIHGYAGTIDLIARVNSDLHIVDFKTSQDVWPSFEMQVSAYREALTNGENPIYIATALEGRAEQLLDVSALKTAILQVGYRRNKAGWKCTPVENRFDLFLAAKRIWQHECEGQSPKVRDYPIVISPGAPRQSFEFLSDSEITKIDATVAPLEPAPARPRAKARAK